MKKILIIGSTQSEHLEKLFSNAGYNARAISDGGTASLAGQLKYFFKLFPALLKTDYLYIVFAQRNNSKNLILARLLKKKVIMHWIGTDVYQTIHSDKPEIYTGNIHHICGSKLLHDELKSINISADIIPILPLKMNMDIIKQPEKHSVLIYLPEGKEDFYGADRIRELAIRNPNIEFHIVANQGYKPLELPNVIFHGRLNSEEMNDMYKNISILLRIPKHDGLSMMVIEALAKGKQVLYKYEHPYVYTPKSLNIDDLDKTFKEIIATEPSENKKGHDYVAEYYTEKEIMGLYRKYKVFE